MSLRRSLIATFVLSLFSAALPAAERSLTQVDLPPIAPAPQKIPLNGRPGPWRSIAGLSFNPLAGLVKSGGNVAIEKLLSGPVSVSLKTCYDPDALYVLVVWHDAHLGENRTPAGDVDRWAEGGEGFELHLRTDRTLHLACWPAASGRRLAVMACYDEQSAWSDAAATVAAVSAPGEEGGELVQELRIPWSAITAAGKLPADGKVELGADFVWNALPASLLDAVREARLASYGACRGVDACFLTARPSLIAAGHLANPADWGELIFGPTTAGGQAVRAPDGSTSLNELAVPVAKSPPTIDGSLAEWEPSSFQAVGYLQSLWGQRYTGRIAAQFDRDNLYLAAHFASRGPMSNKQAQNTQQGFSGGDALQVRLSNGLKKINLCGWFDSTAGRPALTGDPDNLPNPFLLQQGAIEAFRVDDDRYGYTQEIALPWKLLFGAAPKPGQRLKATFQPWWADLSPRFSLHAKAMLQRQGALGVAYHMPANDQLTLGLFDGRDRLLRWIVQDDFRTAGAQSEPWDGLDQWGQPLPSGEYRLKAAYHPPLAVEYKLTVCNPGNPPWPTPDDKGDWLSDEADPQAVVSDGQWVFLGAAGCELGYSVIGLDETGQRRWGIRVPFNPRCVSLALDSDCLNVLYSGPDLTDTSLIYNGRNAFERAILMCLDKRTGRPRRFTRETPYLRVAVWPYREEISWLWDLRNNRSFSPARYGGQPRYYRTDLGESTGALGLAAAGGKLYVSLFYENKLLALDAATGKPTGESIPVAAPVGLCKLDEQTLLAVSGRQVVRVDLAAKSATPLVVVGLAAPHSVTLDESGNIFVSDWGASFQVKVFTPAGRFLRTIGKEGGRPWVGAWVPQGMLVPRGIAVTRQGKLWVAEDDGSPKRVSVWDSRSGALLRDYIGPSPYGGGTYFWIDPHDPSQFNAEGTRFQVDLARRTCRPAAIAYRRVNRDDPFTPNGHNLGASKQVRILYRGGREYAVFNLDRGVVSILRRQGDVYRPVAAFGIVHRDPNPKMNGTGDETFLRDDFGYHVYKGSFPACFRGHLGDNYSWTDANGDSLVEPEEMRWVKTSDAAYRPGAQGRCASYWGNDLSPDWSYFFAARFRDRLAVFRLDLKGWTAAGAPIYDMADARPIVFFDAKHGINSLHVTADRKLLVCFDYEWGKSPDAVACFDLQGHPLWASAMPKRFEGKQLHANVAMYDFQIPGLGDVVCSSLYHGSMRPSLFTSDGLYLGTFLDGGSKLGPAALWGESQPYFYQSPDRTPYVVNGGNQAEHLFRIKGLEAGAVGRFQGTYRLTANDVQRAAAMREVPTAAPPPRPVLAVAWLDNPPAIDGDLGDWNLARGVAMDGGNGRSAEVALGRDKNKLYLAYQVHERRPLQNGGADWQTLFATGDCVDLMLAANAQADLNRRAAVPGDLRLLLSVFQGRPVAVLYRPVVLGVSAPVTISTIRIDRVTRLAAAEVAVSRDTARGLYTVEAAVPLAELGIDPAAATALRGDVGVIFADESGRSRSLRLYYYNHHTEMVSDVPTEATLQPAEWGPLVMPLGRNLLRNGGFEEPLVESREQSERGWFAVTAQNGSGAAFSTESPYSGRRSLLLETTVPVTFPPTAYDAPDYNDFRRSANGGKGGGWTEVLQKIPVTAGHRYSLRYRYRCEDFQPERKQPGHPRGYVSFYGRIDWLCRSPHRGSSVGVAAVYESTPDWRTVTDFRGWDMSTPFLAPEGAAAAQLVFGLKTLAEGRLPKLFLDDVELVDVTP
jgi:hypothetical protein